MSLDLAFTPSGRVIAVEDSAEETLRLDGSMEASADGRLKKAAKTFAASQAEGLFLLATERFDGPLPPSLAFWRDFAARYLTALCHTPEIAGDTLGEPIPPPDDGRIGGACS